MASIALGDMCDLARWPHGMAGGDLPRGFHLGSRGLDNMLQQVALSLVSLAATIGGMPHVDLFTSLHQTACKVNA
jgi:hypothetical protein